MEPHSRPWSTSEAASMNTLAPAFEAFQFADSPTSQEGAGAADAWYSYPTLASQEQQYRVEAERDVPLMYPKPSLPIGVSDLVDRAGDELAAAPEGGYFGYMGASEEEGDLTGVVV
ncbi:uncharacterized protein SCHCODRAFT_01117388 [Schizophyllum commune H4-8]|uniref:Expressed protein n=1 Tax=Schizophyllum commune (strain H4-8 / FGSC 9210) TaxID=578458 RepID=D8PUZ4_SCHCM|nr:uncharacterized protein SCHCODRAFT_01117388 [Schizophyllum commune H4-8]KAI5900561.1 hypothetical protein SCHCODRAFT_01117388 [Schizophyllum commune H4-8]